MTRAISINRDHGGEMRDMAAQHAWSKVADGSLFEALSRRVALRTTSEAGSVDILLRYLKEEMEPELTAMGFDCEYIDRSETGNPILIARRFEHEDLPTILGYGHGDVVDGAPDSWSEGFDPWVLKEANDAWYGRGIVDNKGQHTINLAAMKTVLDLRGRLGFNAVWLIEMGEETGSPGLREACKKLSEKLKAQILIASDGPRVSASRPTLFLGTRGAVNFSLTLRHRDTGHHSGNWGGLLANPAVQLSHAISAIASATGKINVAGWTPTDIPQSVRRALSSIEVSGGLEGPPICPQWGEPGLSAAEQLYGWSSFEVLALTSGNPARAVNAVPPSATAYCQLRTVVGVDEERVIENLRRHLDSLGHDEIRIENPVVGFRATRLDPDDAWVRWVEASVAQTTGKPTAILPNVGGSLPNDVFSEILGMRTIWIPHSYPGARNHGGNEHLPLSVAREALRIMASLYWDLGDPELSRPAIF